MHARDGKHLEVLSAIRNYLNSQSGWHERSGVLEAIGISGNHR